MKSNTLNTIKKMLYKRHPYVGAAKQVAFIVGTGRCGTTILAQVLNAHSQICVPPELQFIIQYGSGERLYEKYIANELQYYRAKDFIKLVRDFCPYQLEKYFNYKKHFKALKYPQTDMQTIVQEFFDHICFDKGKSILCEQTPWHGQFLFKLQKLFSRMKVIHMVRDGRDVSISFTKTPWWSTDVYKNMKQWEHQILRIHQFGAVNKEQYIAVRYEDLVDDPVAELKRILNFLGISFEPRILDPNNLIDYFSLFKDKNVKFYYSDNFKKWDKNKADVFFKESVYSWKRNKSVDTKLMTSIAKDTLLLFGYEV